MSDATTAGPVITDSAIKIGSAYTGLPAIDMAITGLSWQEKPDPIVLFSLRTGVSVESVRAQFHAWGIGGVQ